MKQTAQGLAALGRGPDTQLVHMAPSEVAGLQALAEKHGGSLTINPDTGLPEAGFLSSILPMVIGAGLMASGVGAPMAAMLVGGGTAVATGSLEKGLMAGLGAYGGAGIAEGLMGAGASSLSAGAGAAAEVPLGAIVPEVAAPAANMAANNVSAGLAAANEAQLVAANTIPAGAYAGPSSLAEASNFTTAPYTATPMPVVPAAPASTGPVPTMSPTGDFARFDRALSPGLGASPMDQMGAGFQSVTSSPGAAWEFTKANYKPLGAAGISALGAMEPDALNAPAPKPGMIRPYTYSREKIPGAFQDVAGDPRSSKERRYFNDAYTPGTPYKAPGPEYMADGGSIDTVFADGGISNLGSYSDGGRLLRGPGDGVSDSIPAMIGQKQKARLADGEFVVPARIVSELGNGSTEAGARQLYAMMDRVQKNRKKSMGKDKVATDAKSHRLLPA